MACAAVRSVMEQASGGVQVVVSDNSTDPLAADAVARFCAEFDDAAVRYIRPAEPLPMPAHWQWALRTVLDESPATHVAYLTDRMVMKRGELAGLLELARAHPDQVISYNHDLVDDWLRPVSLHLYDWTARLFEVSAEHLLYLSSRAVIRPPLPRMMNSLAPRAVFDRLQERFGSVFDSISPDFCFTYRCLDTVDSILYYDKAILVQYALDRSNGASYSRGDDAPDRLDFAAQLGRQQMNYAAPVPQFRTIRNAIVHEYCFVKQETGSARFPDVDPRAYIAAVVEDFSQIENTELRAAMFDVLRDNGWVGAPRTRYAGGLALLRLAFRGWDVLRTVTRAGLRAARTLFGERRARLLARLGVRVPTSLIGFRCAEAAIEFANRHPRAPAATLDHLEPLLTPPGATTEVPTGAATPAPGRILV
jgi:hypothetical protein